MHAATFYVVFRICNGLTALGQRFGDSVKRSWTFRVPAALLRVAFTQFVTNLVSYVDILREVARPLGLWLV